ncbi:MAG: hypothetical protein LBJ57_05635 [Prevotellaceae bacterium]|nr:hypothetical protein [Prevotellaceae bacterium]
MKKILLTVRLSLYLTAFVLAGCKPNVEETWFDNTVTLLEDELPKYTEYGYNTAGAKIVTSSKDWVFNQNWTLYSSYNTPSARISKKAPGLLQFAMIGQKGIYGEKMDLLFDFPAEISDSLSGLYALVNQKFTSQHHLLETHLSYGEDLANTLTVTSGLLFFTRSRRIIYSAGNNKEVEGVSLSGTFEVTATMVDEMDNDANVTVSSGRFDILFWKFNGVEFTNVL